MKKIVMLSLLLLGSGCATIQSISKVPVGLIADFAIIIDQSTECVMGITEYLDGPWLYRNTCGREMTLPPCPPNQTYKQTKSYEAGSREPASCR